MGYQHGEGEDVSFWREVTCAHEPAKALGSKILDLQTTQRQPERKTRTRNGCLGTEWQSSFELNKDGAAADAEVSRE